MTSHPAAPGTSCLFWPLAAGSALILAAAPTWADGLPIATPARKSSVRFEDEVMPILAANCTACHNEKVKEGGLSMDSHERLLAGGDSGPSVVAGKPAQSVLFLRAAHRQEDFMPPEGNSVGAKPLSPAQLGLLERWIDEGAKATAAASKPVAWRPVPRGRGSVLAVALSADGRTAAAARAGRVSILDPLSGRLRATLVDPALARMAPDLAHADVVASAAFSPAEDLLATGSFRTIKLWRRADVRKLAALPDTAGAALLATAPAGGLVALGRADGRVAVFDLAAVGPEATPRIVGTVGQPARSVGFAADGASIVLAGADNVVTVVRLADGAVVGRLPRPGEVRSIAVAGGGTRLVTAEADGVLRVWPLPLPEAAKPLREIRVAPHPVVCLTEMPTAPGQAVGGCGDGVVRRWDLESGAVVRNFANGGPIAAVAVSPDGTRLAAVGTVAGVKLWDAATGVVVAHASGDFRIADRLARKDADITVLRQDVEHGMAQIAEAKKAEAVAADELKKATEKIAAAEKTLHEREEAAKALPATGDDAEREKARAAAEEAVANARMAVERTQEEREFVSDRARQAAARVPVAQAELAAVEDRLRAAEVERRRIDGDRTASARPFTTVAFSRDAADLVAIDPTGTAFVYGGSDGQPRRAFAVAAQAGLLSAVDDARMVVAGGPNAATVFAAGERWELLRTIGGEQTPPAAADDPAGPPVGPVLALAFAPDGRLLASGGGRASRTGEIKLWKTADGSLAKTFLSPHGDTVVSLAFSRDGERLASGGTDRIARVHVVADGRSERSYEGHAGHVLAVAWQAHGRRLVTGGGDGVIKVWDVGSGEQQRTILGPAREVTGVRFIGEGDEVVAAAGDATVRVVNAVTGANVRPLLGGADFLQSLANAGPTVMVGSQDGRVRIWNVTSPNPLHAIEASPAP